MGNDGGSIPTRKELVQTSAKGPTTSQVFETKQLNGNYLWKQCYLTDKPLKEPIVSDYKGHLFNKEAILEWILDPSGFNKSQHGIANHIKSLRDIVELKITRNAQGRWICPISLKDVENESSSGRFMYFAECGDVFSESALKEVFGPEQSSKSSISCPQCDTIVHKSNEIIINPQTQGEIALLQERLDQLINQGLSHSLKRKKTKKIKDKSKESKNESSHDNAKRLAEPEDVSDTLKRARTVVDSVQRKHQNIKVSPAISSIYSK